MNESCAVAPPCGRAMVPVARRARFTRCTVALACALLAACSAPAALDAGIDAGAADASHTSAADAATPCATDEHCASGRRCLGGTCQPDPCAQASRCDPSAEHCVARCVRTVDPCEGVTCEADETCLDGTCFPGCLPAPCAGRVCPAGRFCDVDGTCRAIHACDAECGAGAACDVACVPRTACDGVTCADGELCRDGVCVANPCSGVRCDPGEICQNGECAQTCDCDPPCAPPERCVANRCTCTPRCPSGAACGAPDGCGGFCAGACSGPQEVCNTDTGECDCVPRCSPTAACGDDDGCGGRCDGPCAGSLTCAGGTCICTDVCSSADAVDCGARIPDTCAGRTCAGAGTRCPSGSDCLDGRCCPACATPFDLACGEPIPDAVDDTGATCRSCGGLGVRCAMGESCIADPPGGSAARVCCGPCADPGSVPCGTALDDVLDASGAVCLVCSLGYGTACPAGQACTGGPRGVCCERCASADSVDCGAPIPDASCRTCPGVGSRCPDGTSCTNPPGTTGGEERECCGACADAASAPCGAALPDVLDASGVVCRTCGEGTMCSRGQVCSDGSCCTPSCAPASTRPCGDTPSDGCGGTCAPGTQCAQSGATCTGDPLACVCTPTCAGRRCGESDGCGGECVGSCDPGFVCTERPPPSPPGDYACEPADCVASCGLCESCVLGVCEPLTCAPGETACFSTCECCGVGESCTPSGCVPFG